MEPPLLLHLTTGLIAWAFLSLGAAVAGLYFPAKCNPANTECWRGFWFMIAIWGLVDGIIGWANLLGGPVEMDFLRNVLLINSGLDLAYITAGIVLATRQKPLLKGFGAAVLIQGVFLLLFDLAFLWLAYRV
jgi:hypothetical protein